MSKGFWYRTGLAAAALIGAASFALPASADAPFFFGQWVNTHPNTNNITHVIVLPNNGGDIKVRAFGQCHPTDCDWGSVYGKYEAGFLGDKIKAEFNSGFSITKLELRPAPGGRIAYEAHIKFTDGSGRPSYDVSGELEHAGGGGYGPPPGPGGGYGPPPGPGGGGYGPPPGPGGGEYGPPPGPMLGAEDCNSFNPASVMASFVGGEWKVVDGGSWMLSYGGDAGAAHHAADIIHHYHFTQQCFVKRPNAAMMYWKTGNHVPGGNTPGQDCIGLNPNTASVANISGSWKVVDGGSWLLDYGPQHAAADKALAVIQTYHLNRQCFIVRPNAAMMYWLSQ